MSNDKSNESFFIRLNGGTESAAAELEAKYRRRLCALVERELSQRYRGREDPEDAVQSALASFYRGVDQKGFHIEDSMSLWALLATITRRKILKHAEYHSAKKRSPDREVNGSIDWSVGQEPSPDEAALVADLIQKTLQGLNPPDPEIFRLRLQGFTRSEIAQKTGCSESIVRCKLDRLRDRLRRLLSESDS
jgi:RNA polymerase sigma-70 factor, ECF subfamily